MSDYKRLKENIHIMSVHNRAGYTVKSLTGGKTEYEVIDEIVSDCSEILNKIEQGTLKEIPCKIGDTLYTNIRWQGDYMRKENAPYPVTVVFIGINDNVDMGGGVINIVNEKGRMWQIDFLDIGKTVFLTREEAEKRLKELQE